MDEGPERPTTDATAADARGWTRHVVADPQQDGMPVATLVHPAGWRAASQVVWDLQQTSAPVNWQAYTVDPSGREGVQWLPSEPCCWLQPAGYQPAGSNRFGLTLVAPMPPVEAMTRLVIPKHRGPGGWRVLDSALVPDLAAQLRLDDLAAVPTTGVRVRTASEVEGRTVVDELYGVHYAFAPIAGPITQQNWGLTALFCLRADLERFDAMRPTLWRIAASLTPNPAWGQRVQQVTQQLNGQFVQRIEAGYAELRQQAAFQQELAAYNQQVRDHQSEAVAASVAHQHAVDDARWNAPGAPGGAGGQSAADALGDQLLGRSAYHDPNSTEGNYWYDDGNHEYVWTDGQGGFVPTDDPNLDPNVGSDRSWTLARRA